MAASISAVARICVAAPAITQGQKIGSGFGRGAPLMSTTPKRKISANGKPNRKRTWVAPTVPSLPCSSRCMALRAVWPAAASKVNTTQSQPVSIMICACSGRGGARDEESDRHAGRSAVIM